MKFDDQDTSRIENMVGDSQSHYPDVYYDAQNGRLVATNGHAMAAVAVEGEPGETSGPISPEVFKAYRALVRKSGASFVSIKAFHGEVILEDRVSKIATRFPRSTADNSHIAAEKVYPNVSGPPSFCLSFGLLSKLIGSLGMDRTDSFVVWPRTAEYSKELTDAVEETLTALKALSTDKEKFPNDTTLDRLEKALKAYKEAAGLQRAMLIKTLKDGAIGVIMPMGYEEGHWNTSLVRGKAAPPLEEQKPKLVRKKKRSVA